MAKETIKVPSTTKVEDGFIYCRGIKRKAVVAPRQNISIIQNYDFEIGPYNEVKVVKTDKTDYMAMAAAHKEETTLAHVCAAAYAKGITLADKPFAYNPEEARDASLDPETPQELQERLEATKGSKAAIEKIAATLGCSVEDIINAHLKGELDSFIKEKTTAKGEEEDGK